MYLDRGSEPRSIATKWALRGGQRSNCTTIVLKTMTEGEKCINIGPEKDARTDLDEKLVRNQTLTANRAERLA